MQWWRGGLARLRWRCEPCAAARLVARALALLRPWHRGSSGPRPSPERHQQNWWWKLEAGQIRVGTPISLRGDSLAPTAQKHWEATDETVPRLRRIRLMLARLRSLTPDCCGRVSNYQVAALSRRGRPQGGIGSSRLARRGGSGITPMKGRRRDGGHVTGSKIFEVEGQVSSWPGARGHSRADCERGRRKPK